MRPEAFAYIAGGAGTGAPRCGPTGPRSGATGSCRGCCATRRGGTRRSSSSGAAWRRRSCWRRSALPRWPIPTPTSRPRVRRRAEGVPMVFSNQASVPMERVAEELGDSPRWFQLYWSTSNELVESFVSRAEACGCEAIVVTLDTTLLGWRTRDLAWASCRSCAAWGSPSTPATRCSSGWWRRSAAPRTGGRRPPAATDSERALDAVLADAAPDLPRVGPALRRRSTPGPRSTGTTCRSCASAPGCRSCSRASATPTTPAARSTSASTAWSCRTTAAGRWTARSRRSTRCRAWWRPWTAPCRCCSTAACAAEPTSSRRWRSARRRRPARAPLHLRARAGRRAGSAPGAARPARRLRPHDGPAGYSSAADIGPEALLPAYT